MPHHKSAAKRLRQTPKRTARNRAARSLFRSALKKADEALAAGDPTAAAAQTHETLEIIGKTQKKGLIHRNKAARHASRIAKRLHALTSKGGAAKSEVAES